MQKIAMTTISVLLIGSILAYADIPHLITYQGRLTDNTGVPVADGSYDLTFTIYDDSTSGSVLWSEVQSITTISGLFNVILGSNTSLSNSVISQNPNLFMGIQLAGSPSEMSPRTRLTSSAFSFRASHADTADYAHAISSGVGGWIDNGNDIILADSSDEVGIGTSNPVTNLDVRGHVYIEQSAHIDGELSIGDVFQFNPNTDLFRSLSGYMNFDNTALLLDNRMAIGYIGWPSCRLWVETEGTLDTISLRVHNTTGTAASFTSGTTGYPSIPVAVSGLAGGSSIASRFHSFGDGHGVVAKTDGVGDAIHSTAAGTGHSGFFEGGAGVLVDGDMEVTGELTLPDGAANGYVLTSDASGVTSWQSPPSGSPWTASAGRVYLNDSTNMVGIGTSNPLEKLDVDGNAHISGSVTIGDELQVDSSSQFGYVDIGSPTQTATLEVYRNGITDRLAFLGTASRGGTLVLYDELGNAYGGLYGDTGGEGGYFYVRRAPSNNGFVIDGNYNSNNEPKVSVLGSQREAIFDMSTNANSSVILPDSSISSDEMFNEPGIASSTSTSSPYLSTTFTDLATVTITIPSSGYIVVDGKCDISLAGTTGRNMAYVQIDETEGGSKESPYYSQMGFLASPNINGYYFPVHVTRTYFKSAGTYTFRLEGAESSLNGAGAYCQSMHQIITAVYYPTSYGTVSEIVESGEEAEFENAVLVETEKFDDDVLGSTSPRYQVDLRELELKAARARAEAAKAERELLEAQIAEQERILNSETN